MGDPSAAYTVDRSGNGRSRPSTRPGVSKARVSSAPAGSRSAAQRPTSNAPTRRGRTASNALRLRGRRGDGDVTIVDLDRHVSERGGVAVVRDGHQGGERRHTEDGGRTQDEHSTDDGS